ncbi:dihydrofolate reductase [Tautonia rosea]|uniref:dihydrofolate reductase n=1 Tax=Tautonia rosea TaxID=2728037 RepID=UPI0014750654|nr:dihydrofolate reductase [Tautonia rosea]
MRCALVVATSPEGIIGRDGSIPWHLPMDLKRFRAITWGHPILMGRRTHESIGQPLPGRLNIIISRTLGPLANGCVVARSPGEALAIARASGADEVMIVGGEQLYRAFLPDCDVLHLTIVEGAFDGDARFPIEAIHPDDWIVEHRESWPSDERHAFPHRYERLRRVRASGE